MSPILEAGHVPCVFFKFQTCTNIPLKLRSQWRIQIYWWKIVQYIFLTHIFSSYLYQIHAYITEVENKLLKMIQYLFCPFQIKKQKEDWRLCWICIHVLVDRCLSFCPLDVCEHEQKFMWFSSKCYIWRKRAFITILFLVTLITSMLNNYTVFMFCGNSVFHMLTDLYLSMWLKSLHQSIKL